MSLFFFFFLVSTLPSPSFSQNLSSFSSLDSPWRPTDNKLLLSPNSLFAAGFQRLPFSPDRFTFSVWYLNISQTPVVWSANDPNSPLNSNASLLISNTSQLRLVNASGSNLWPGTTSGSQNSSKLVLQDNGNLVYDKWQSFDLPTDTILPNQTITPSTKLVSNNGKFNFLNGSVLVFLSSNDSYWSSDNAFQVLDEDGQMTQANSASFISADFGAARLRRLTLDDDGNLRIYSFDQSLNKWTPVWQAVQELCKVYGVCGENAICVNDASGSDSTSCVCPPGFKNSSGQANSSCERKIQLKNLGNTMFLPLDYVNFSGGSNQTSLNVANFSLCESSCLKNPKCLGFGFKYDGQGYCVIQDKLLYGYWSPGTEMTFFLRVDKSENDVSNFTGMTSLLETTCPVNISLPQPPKDSNSTTRNIIIVCTLFAAELISGALFFWAFLKKYIKYRDMARTLGLELLPAGGPKRFTFSELNAATNGFSNLIGKGGFGDVYKGELPDHRVVAVKRLSHVTGGDAEFWAEVTIIARMHHLNLVRLWGFCAEKGQRILVYEYVPNGSLDKYLFRVFKEMKVEDILDRHIKNSYDSRLHFDMVDRMVKTAMWCLQDRPEMRPSMGKVAKMLEGTVEIMEPKKPTIFFLGEE
ncbi:hypothetical protein Patl1_15602 [Pistacia atlantica]|uniref:Uncharacterized protein n=1 Tax=Pistacia atlantica TaxID=434234 RepID=A0ACC1B9C8_9ROSI|nr:hypothetical protein Patl1_15602 [Pistacia atlantica]